MCEYCGRHGYHLMGCPNAPEPELLGYCEKCGDPITENDEREETSDGFLCIRCWENLRYDQWAEDHDTDHR